MHEHATLELIDYRLSKVQDRSKVTKIVVCELEVHEPEEFKKRLRAFLKNNYPDVRADIEIVSPLVSRGIKLISSQSKY